MQKFMLQSGKVVELSLAPIETALNLYRTIICECKNTGLDLKVIEGETIADIILKNTEALLNILGSQQVLEAVQECSAKNLYDKQRFSMELFEDEKARGDFLPLIYLTAVENIRPFFPNLHTIFSMVEDVFLKG